MNNRELKFKAWDKNNKEMVMVKEVRFDKSRKTPKTLLVRFNNGDEINEYADSFELMQYIGIKDKNGKEIYEGDLVTFHTEYERSGTDDYYFENEPTVVKWKESRAGFWPFYLNGRWRCDVVNIEIVGNKFSNPELID